jgi:hypothetical protein
MPIFVDTDHGPKNKLYDGSKAGNSATAVEGKMQSTVVRLIDKTAGFTTTEFPKAKGYAIRLEFSKLDTQSGPDTVVKLSGFILRWPKTVAQAGKGKGDEFITLGWTGGGKASGHSEGSLLDVVEAIIEGMMPNGIQAMKNDWPKWQP